MSQARHALVRRNVQYHNPLGIFPCCKAFPIHAYPSPKCLSKIPFAFFLKKNHYIFSSQLRADQMPGPPRDGQLMCTLFLSTRQQIEQHMYTNDVILPHEESHGITLKRLKQVLIPITQILQPRALKHKVLLIC